jgi:uncharacterized membrane protein YoaK (UPF0700 family)
VKSTVYSFGRLEVNPSDREDDVIVWLQCAKQNSGTCTLTDYRSMTRVAFPEGIGANWQLSSRRVGTSPSRASSLKVFGSEAAGAVILSAVAGYVDTAGFLALFGLFTAHITGDLITAGMSLTGRLKFGAGARLIMIPVFMASVAATTLLARVLRRRGKPTLPPLLALMTVALGIFGLTGVTLRPMANQPDAVGVVIIGAAGVVAMGIQNTLMRNALSSYSPTTIMTGNLTQCTIDLVEMWLPSSANNTIGRKRARLEAVERLRKFGFPLLGFMLGAFAGAWLTHEWGLASISVPTMAIGVLALAAWSSEVRRARRAPKSTRREAQTVAPGKLCSKDAPLCVRPTGTLWLNASLPLDLIARHLHREMTARSGTYPKLKYPKE